MLSEATSFMLCGDDQLQSYPVEEDAVANDEVRMRMQVLADELLTLYVTHIRRSSGKLCCICGKGDDGPRRVTNKMRGYEGRRPEAPHLCWAHRTGWSLSYESLSRKHPDATEQHIDLHMALYVAKCLAKEAHR